jgi:universal stress protein A
MDNYKHILLAVDFTQDVDQLIERTLMLRDCCAAQLSIVHVVEYIPLAYSGDLSLPDDFNLEQEMAQIARRKMLELGERMAVATRNQHIVLGATTQEIMNLVAEIGADLIIVGSHGRHGLAMLLGSTANSILHHAKCDTLAIRIDE